MHTTWSADLHHHHRTLAVLAAGALGVIVAVAVAFTADELRTDGARTPGSGAPSAERAPAAGPQEVPSLFEADPQAFDRALATTARTLSRLQGAPSLLEGDHGLFEAAIAHELVELRLDR